MKRITLAAFGAALCLASLGVASADQPITVVVNGSPVTFDQPPIERGGRLYVPLRGVFERLGASVVYSAGTINATSGGKTIELTVGSTQATVNGQTTQLDSHTLVPLRFLSQALGATVNYDSSADTVTITQGGPAPAPQPAPFAIHILRAEPANHATIVASRPEISASFANAIDPNATHVILDGRDVTSAVYLSDRSFAYTPQSDIPYGVHDVRLNGVSRRGHPFAAEWTFSTTPGRVTNFIRDLGPANGQRVGSKFTIHGFTLPGSRVHVIAVANATVQGFAQVTEGSSIVDVTAGDDGHFDAQLSIFDIAAGVVDVRIVSNAPDGSNAIRTLRLRP
jgi:hypothetical protein